MFKITTNNINIELLKSKAEIDINCSSINITYKGSFPVDDNFRSYETESLKLTSNVDIENVDIENITFNTLNNINNLKFINSRVTAGEIRNLNNLSLTFNSKFNRYNESSIDFILTPNNIKSNFQNYGDAVELAGKNYFELPAVRTSFTIKEQNPVFDDLVLVFKNGAVWLNENSPHQNYNYFVDNTSYKNNILDEPIRINLIPWSEDNIFAINIENYLTKDEFIGLFDHYNSENKDELYNDYIKQVKESQEKFKIFKQKYLKIFTKDETQKPVYDIKGNHVFDKNAGRIIKKFLPLKVEDVSRSDGYVYKKVSFQDENILLNDNEGIKILCLDDSSEYYELRRSNFKPGCFTYNDEGKIESPLLKVEEYYAPRAYIGILYENDMNLMKSHIVKRAKNAILHSIYFLSQECKDSEIENVIIYGTPRDLRHLTDNKTIKNIGFYPPQNNLSISENCNRGYFYKFKNIDGLYTVNLDKRPGYPVFGCSCRPLTAVHAENCTFKFNEHNAFIVNNLTFNYDCDKNKLVLLPGEYLYAFSAFINLNSTKISYFTGEEQCLNFLKDRSNRLPVKFADNKMSKTIYKEIISLYNDPLEVMPIIDTGDLIPYSPEYREKSEKYRNLFEQKLTELRANEGVEWTTVNDVWLFRKHLDGFNYTLNIGETEFGYQIINDRVINTNPLNYLTGKCRECDDKNNIKLIDINASRYGLEYGKSFVFNDKKYRIVRD